MQMTQNYRNTDPVTSQLAGDGITHSGKRMTHMIIAIGVVRQYPGHTSAELAHTTGVFDRYEFARRLSDAHTAQKISRGEPRKCSVTGKQSITWYPL